jgi:hypothetical protein
MATTYKYIAGTTLSTAGSVAFTSIPQTFTDLALVIRARGDYASTVYERIWIRVNSTSSHAEVGTYATGGGTGAFLGDRTDYWYKNNYIPSDGGSGSQFSTSEFLIANYSSTTQPKSMIGHSQASYTTTATRFGSVAGIWNETSAVTRLDIITGNGNFKAGSSFYLYGIS